jgi:hypothetical protein
MVCMFYNYSLYCNFFDKKVGQFLMAYVRNTSFFRVVPGLFGCAKVLVSTRYCLFVHSYTLVRSWGGAAYTRVRGEDRGDSRSKTDGCNNWGDGFREEHAALSNSTSPQLLQQGDHRCYPAASGYYCLCLQVHLVLFR